jgi:hypothetical protein
MEAQHIIKKKVDEHEHPSNIERLFMFEDQPCEKDDDPILFHVLKGLGQCQVIVDAENICADECAYVQNACYFVNDMQQYKKKIGA